MRKSKEKDIRLAKVYAKIMLSRQLSRRGVVLLPLLLCASASRALSVSDISSSSSIKPFSIDTLTTPAVIIDKDTVEANVKRVSRLLLQPSPPL